MAGSPKVSTITGQSRTRASVKKKFIFRPGKKLPVLIAIFLLFYLLVSFCAHFQKLYALQKDIKYIESQLQELSAKNEDLKRQLKQVQSDAYIEQVAREKLGLVKPGESKIVPMPKDAEKTN